MIRLLTTLRRTAALAILAVLVSGVGWAAYSLEAARKDSLDGIQIKRELLGKLMSIGSRSQEIEAALSAAKDNPGRAWFMEGESEALITAQLQQRLQEIVAVHGAQFLRASEAEPVRSEDQDYRGLRIELNGSLESIQRVLIDMETGIPYLFITHARFGADAAFQGSPQAPLQLQAELDVYGAVLPATPSATTEP